MIVQSQPTGADAWLVVAGPTSLLALPAAESARVTDLTARLAAADGFRAALESLVSNGIASAPSFALLDGDAAVLRAVLRGEASVAATVTNAGTDADAGAELAFSGAGMATWTERVLEGVGRVQLRVPGSTWTVLLAADASAASATPIASAATPATEPTRAEPVAVLGENTLVPRQESEPPAAPVATAAPAAAPEKPDVEEPQAVPDSGAYDFLFGDTIYRTQAGVAIRIPNPDPERPGDHDGQTMLAEDLGLASRTPATPEASVLAQIPPRASAGDSLPSLVHAPSLPLAVALQLERADGSRETLNRPVLIGRAPVASGSDSDIRLLMISDDPDISRSHLRVAVEGDAVVVTDLGSKNGSIITLPGTAPRKLRASEPTVVLPGTLIDLGGGTTFTVRED